jgi:beta-mannosidase
MRQVISLNGPDWFCAESHLPAPDVAELEQVKAQSIPASVPGEVRLDLIRAGLLEGDLFYGQNVESGRWVEERDWWYWRDFPLALQPGQRAWLRLHGADYITWTYLNERLLGHHEGMFSRQVYEITQLLRENNRLAVRFLAPAHFPRNRSKRPWKFQNRVESVFVDVTCDPDRRDTLKCQMSYGWDFAPSLRTIGLWDDVDVIVTGEVALFDVQVKTRLSANLATLTVSFDADALTPGPATFVLTLAGQTFECEPVTRSFEAALPAGRSRLTFEMDAPNPRLWATWDRGEPNLYTLTVEVQRERPFRFPTGESGASHGRQALDRVEESVGLRQLETRRNPGAPPDANEWTFVINGQPVYLRGANWVPADAFPARVTQDNYAALLEMARAANLNALRVWGGGLREKKAFYDLCDRMGILVWQEFPLACAFLTRYPSSPEYLELVEREVREIVRQLRNHPALILWCGGNEFSTRANRPVIKAMQQVVMAEDGTRRFQEASPAGGESHNWNVWHEFRPPADYQRDTAQLMSEFGLQAPPVVASLHRFIPPDELWPPGPSWKYHRTQMAKLRHYARPFQPSNRQSPHPDFQLATFVIAAQRAQARGIQIAVEHARRRKYATSGFLVWQLNSPWPAIDWALVDYYGTPKLAYYVLAEIANPLLVSLDYPLRRYSPGHQFTADVWVVNDWLRDFPGCRVEVALERPIANRPSGEPAASNQQVFEVNVKPDSAEIVGRIAWTLPDGDLYVACRLVQGDRVLSINRYNLSEYDSRAPSSFFVSWHRTFGMALML